MATDVTIPTDLWEEDNEAVISTWLVDNGATVEKGDLLAEIMLEKIVHELHAPAGGTIEITKDVDEVVAKGEVIAKIE